MLVCFAGGWWRARQEMSNLCTNYDSSTAGDALLRALVACGASDVAHSLSESRSSTQVCPPCFECTLHLFLHRKLGTRTFHPSPCSSSDEAHFRERMPWHRCPPQRRLPQELWKADGTHWWQRLWQHTELPITIQGGRYKVIAILTRVTHGSNHKITIMLRDARPHMNVIHYAK